MPHIIIKVYPGRTMAQKRALCLPVGKALSDAMGIELEHISVSIEEVERERWDEQVRNGELVERAADIVIPEHTKAEDWA
jgi:4-oxalocrotonate tautomerase